MTMILADSSVWGNIPQWFSAVGTVGSLLSALWLLREGQKDRVSQRQAEHERVARRVSAWSDILPKKPVLWVQNLSDEPVYDVVAYIGKMWTNLSALPEPDNMYIEPVFGVIPPGQKLDFTIEDRKQITGAPFPDTPAVAVEFTDARGTHWRRFEDGSLKQIKSRRSFD